ncbi:hypothetical protein [Paenibacillus sp. Soil766]|nr:hypothetical protein [Paenibacillus sp. Soil766]
MSRVVAGVEVDVDVEVEVEVDVEVEVGFLSQINGLEAGNFVNLLCSRGK